MSLYLVSSKYHIESPFLTLFLCFGEFKHENTKKSYLHYPFCLLVLSHSTQQCVIRPLLLNSPQGIRFKHEIFNIVKISPFVMLYFIMNKNYQSLRWKYNFSVGIKLIVFLQNGHFYGGSWGKWNTNLTLYQQAQLHYDCYSIIISCTVRFQSSKSETEYSESHPKKQ